MNARMLELFDQSFTDHQGESLNAKRFAELIVAECAKVADATSVSGPPKGCTYGNVIHEHFGIGNV